MLCIMNYDESNILCVKSGQELLMRFEIHFCDHIMMLVLYNTIKMYYFLPCI